MEFFVEALEEEIVGLEEMTFGSRKHISLNSELFHYHCYETMLYRDCIGKA